MDELQQQLQQLGEENRSLQASLVAQQSRPPEIKIVEKEVIREVPVVEHVEVPVEKIVEVRDEKLIQSLTAQLEELTKQLQDTQPTAKDAQHDLKVAARLMANSEMNKEDLSEQEIYDFLIKCSEDEVKKKMGFWAIPLPKQDDADVKNTKYTGKQDK